MHTMINIGAGWWKCQGWKTMGNHTSYENEYDIKYDVTSYKPLPFEDSTVHLFFSSFMLEHIPNPYVDYLFKETHRCLKDGGGIRLAIPDVESAYNAYKCRDYNWFRRLIRQKNAHLIRHPFVLKDLFCSRDDEGVSITTKNLHKYNDHYREFKSNLAKMGMEELFDHYTIGLKQNPDRGGDHINWYTEKKLTDMLSKAGFDEIYRSEVGESRYQEMRNNDMFDNYKNRGSWALIVEAIKHG